MWQGCRWAQQKGRSSILPVALFLPHCFLDFCLLGTSVWAYPVLKVSGISLV